MTATNPPLTALQRECAASLATIRSAQDRPLGFEASDALAMRIERLYAELSATQTELAALKTACVERPDDPSDRRRRIYIDGEGEAWLSLSSDREIRYIGKVTGAFHGDDTTDTVRERTGSLREIGRCW